MHTNIKRLDKVMGKVIGFTIEWEGQKKGCPYISFMNLKKKKN
jgi:hypothetical protein